MEAEEDMKTDPGLYDEYLSYPGVDSDGKQYSSLKELWEEFSDPNTYYKLGVDFYETHEPVNFSVSDMTDQELSDDQKWTREYVQRMREKFGFGDEICLDIGAGFGR